MNIIILFVLSYIIPIIVFCILVYCDMEKGESIEEYLDTIDNDMYIFFFLPILNITLVLILICYFYGYFLFNKRLEKIIMITKIHVQTKKRALAMANYLVEYGIEILGVKIKEDGSSTIDCISNTDNDLKAYCELIEIINQFNEDYNE